MVSEKEYLEAVEAIKKYYLQNPTENKGDDFAEWREKYFKVGIRIQSHQSKHSGRRYTNSELYKKFKKSRGI